MTRMLFFKIDQEQWSLLKPFLIMFSHLPETLVEGSKIINTVDISLDDRIVRELRVI